MKKITQFYCRMYKEVLSRLKPQKQHILEGALDFLWKLN